MPVRIEVLRACGALIRAIMTKPCKVSALVAFALMMCAPGLEAQQFDVVIAGGRVIDPETGLDAVRHVGVRGGQIAAVSERPLEGASLIDARGKVVAPGFIDLHQHSRMNINPTMYRHKAMDGVTTALELEVGTHDVDRWYRERDGKALINYGVSIGHIKVRMAVMKDPAEWLPSGPAARDRATEAQRTEISRIFERGFERGAIAAGFGFVYTPGADEEELLDLFRVAARYNASAHVHIRGGDRAASLSEALRLAEMTKAPLHIVHIQSSQNIDTPTALQRISEVVSNGLDVTTEAYPYTGSMNRIESAPWDRWAEHPERFSDADFHTLLWPATGERLTRETFLKYRKMGGNIIRFSNTEEAVKSAIGNPIVMIASDGNSNPGEPDHPRTTATFTRVLGQYVREDRLLSLPLAIRKMTLMPAKRLENRVPAMRNKGRLQVGADADIVVFDPNSVKDLATYEQPAKDSVGVQAVLVAGMPVVANGRLVEGVFLGKAVRAPLARD